MPRARKGCKDSTGKSSGHRYTFRHVDCRGIGGQSCNGWRSQTVVAGLAVEILMSEKKMLNYLAVSYDTASKPKTAYPDHLMQHVTELLGLKGGSAVDVGCGRGDQLFALERLGFEVAGLDIERSAEDIPRHHVCDVGRRFSLFPTRRWIWPSAKRSLSICICRRSNISCWKCGASQSRTTFCRLDLTPDWRYMYRDFYVEFTHVSPFTVRSLEQCMRMYGLVDVSVRSFIQLPPVWRYPWLEVCT